MGDSARTPTPPSWLPWQDVIEVYHRPHDPDRPVVCVDETSKQLIVETRTPIPAKPGRPKRVDYEYQRNGTANLFMMFAPLEGWREVKVTDQRAAVDYAQMLKELSDTHFPQASKIVLVQDNLSTHKPASLYGKPVPAEEARRLVERFEWHYTPKHGSWLDMAESELSVLSRQCLSRRIPDKNSLLKEVDSMAETPKQQARQGRLALRPPGDAREQIEAASTLPYELDSGSPSDAHPARRSMCRRLADQHRQ